MNTNTTILLLKISKLEARVAELESERGPVRCDGLVASSFASDVPDTQDRPHCAGQGAHRVTKCKDVSLRNEIAAAWKEERLILRLREVIKSLDKINHTSAAAAIAAFIDRSKGRTAVVSEP